MTPTLNPVVYILLWIVAFIAAIFIACLLVRLIYHLTIGKHERDEQ